MMHDGGWGCCGGGEGLMMYMETIHKKKIVSIRTQFG
jgi:Fe-S oxidoreductase